MRPEVQAHNCSCWVCHTASSSCPSLPYNASRTELPDHVIPQEHSVPVPLLERSTSRMLFDRTMHYKQLLHASTRKLQDDMKHNMRRYMTEKVKLQEQLATLHNELEEYHSTGNIKVKLDELTMDHNLSLKTTTKTGLPKSLENTQAMNKTEFRKWPQNNGKSRQSGRILQKCPHYHLPLDQATCRQAAKQLMWCSVNNLYPSMEQQMFPPTTKSARLPQLRKQNRPGQSSCAMSLPTPNPRSTITSDRTDKSQTTVSKNRKKRNVVTLVAAASTSTVISEMTETAANHGLPDNVRRTTAAPKGTRTEGTRTCNITPIPPHEVRSLSQITDTNSNAVTNSCESSSAEEAIEEHCSNRLHVNDTLKTNHEPLITPDRNSAHTKQILGTAKKTLTTNPVQNKFSYDKCNISSIVPSMGKRHFFRKLSNEHGGPGIGITPLLDPHKASKENYIKDVGTASNEIKTGTSLVKIRRHHQLQPGGSTEKRSRWMTDTSNRTKQVQRKHSRHVLPSITLRPPSRSDETERMSSTQVKHQEVKDSSVAWKALYLTILDPDKRSQMLADIMFAVRRKMRQNELQLRNAETPTPIKSTLCDFLLFKPQNTTVKKPVKKLPNPKDIPSHTAIRATRKSTRAQLQGYLRRSMNLKQRPMIEHLEAEEYRLTRYGPHKYLLSEINK